MPILRITLFETDELFTSRAQKVLALLELYSYSTQVLFEGGDHFFKRPGIVYRDLCFFELSIDWIL